MVVVVMKKRESTTVALYDISSGTPCRRVRVLRCLPTKYLGRYVDYLGSYPVDSQ